jgi:hypothetical protein
MRTVGKTLIKPYSLAVAAMLAFVLAACGGGGSTGSSEITREAFVKQADAICSKATTKVSKGLQEEGKSLNGKQLDQGGEERILATLTGPAIVQMSEELSDLGAPTGQEARVEAFVSEYEAAGKRLEAEPKSGLEEDIFSGAAVKANAYGVKACGQL